MACANALVAMSVRRLPVGTAERYLEEMQADLADLECKGPLIVLMHALGVVSSSRRLNMAVAASPLQPGRTWALRALAHLGLAPDQRDPDGCRDGAYVFSGRLRWHPLRHDEPPIDLGACLSDV